MLQNIRDNLQGTLAKIIIAAISVPFVAFGIESLIQGGSSSDVADVNGEAVSEADLRQAIVIRQRQIVSQMGDKFDPSMLQEENLKGPALEALISQKILLVAAEQADIAVSESAIDQLIIGNKEFQVDGKFSAERFQELLNRAGFTVRMYKDLMKNELTINQQASGIAQSGFVTSKEAELATGLLNEKRDLSYSVLSVQDEISKVSVDENQIKAYYDKHADDFYSPEQVMAEYIELKIEQFFPEISEEELKSEYESVVANFKTSEQRRVSHILLKTKDRSEDEATKNLQELKARIAKGELFPDLAKQYSEDAGSKASGGDLGFAAEGVFPAPLMDAIKNLNKGDVSEPVVSDSGVHLLYVADIVKNVPPAFDAEKDAIKLRLQKDRAAKAFVTASERLADATFNAPDLTGIAKELKLEVKTSEPVVRDTPASSGIFSNKKVLDELFSDEVLGQNLNSDLIELVPGENTVVVRVKEHHPKELRPLDVVAADIKKILTQQQAKANIKARADEYVAQVRSGKTVAQLNWKSAKGITRSTGDAPYEIVSAAFDVPPPPENRRTVLSKPLANGDIVIIDVSNAMRSGGAAGLDMQTEAIRRFLAQNDGREAYSAWQQNLVNHAEVERKLK
jgi:peptidyl-prolyl cis-trans isomerase D